MGNPLLDISAPVDQSFFDKYDIKPSNAILAEAKHLPMYEELSNMANVDYIGGGSTLNTIRVCQWMLSESRKSICQYMGCIAKDKFGTLLQKSANNAGVTCHWNFSNTKATGTCAVALLNKERSLVANLAAANEFPASHMDTTEAKVMLASANIFYSAGFFITVSPESMCVVGEYALANNRVFGINLSAPFIMEFFKEQLAKVLVYATHIFTNDDEAKKFAEVNGITYKDTIELAAKMSTFVQSKRSPYTVIVTQGKDPVLVANNGKVIQFDVVKLDAKDIIDFNGAGDAFVGGFLSQLYLNQNMETCVKAGNYCARTIIQTSGTKLSGTPKFS